VSKDKTQVALFVEHNAIKIGKFEWMLDTNTPLRHVNKSNARFNRKNPKAHSDWALIQAEEKAVAIVSRIAKNRNRELCDRIYDENVVVHIWVFIGRMRIGKNNYSAKVRCKRLDCDGVKGIIDGIEAGGLIYNDNQVTALHVYQAAVAGQHGDRVAIVIELSSENTQPVIDGFERLLAPRGVPEL